MSDKKTLIGVAEDYEAKEKGPHKFKVLGKTINVWATQYQSDEPNPLALKAKSGAHGVWEFDEKPDEFNGQTITRRWLTRFAEVDTASAWANEGDVAPESGAGGDDAPEQRAAATSDTRADRPQANLQVAPPVPPPGLPAPPIDSFTFGSISRVVAGAYANGIKPGEVNPDVIGADILNVYRYIKEAEQQGI